jgi:hypothetical protein
VRAAGLEPAIPEGRDVLSVKCMRSTTLAIWYSGWDSNPRPRAYLALAGYKAAALPLSYRSKSGGWERSRTPNSPSLTNIRFQDERTCQCTNPSKLGGLRRALNPCSCVSYASEVNSLFRVAALGLSQLTYTAQTLAETAGFEPASPFTVNSLSKRARSTTLPRLQKLKLLKLAVGGRVELPTELLPRNCFRDSRTCQCTKPTTFLTQAFSPTPFVG